MKKNSFLSFFIFLVFMTCTYKNSEDCIEQIKQNCICTKEYKPVCGCNKKTYGNACTAECAGITIYTVGECK